MLRTGCCSPVLDKTDSSPSRESTAPQIRPEGLDSLTLPQARQKGKVQAYQPLPPAKFWDQRSIALAVLSGRIAGMAKLEGRPVLSLSIVVVLTEEEAAALDALAGYGVESFLKVFYEKMGKAYLQPHEAGLRSLFDSILNGECSVKHLLNCARVSREAFGGRKTDQVGRTGYMVQKPSSANEQPPGPQANAGGEEQKP